MLLKVSNLEKSYGRQIVLNRVSFVIDQGERVGLVGKNGVGKTILLKIIAGIESPDGGRLEFIKGVTRAYMPQQSDAHKVSRVLGESTNTREAKELLGKFGLDNVGVNGYVTSLSGGEQSKLYLIGTFLQHPDIYLLDEPTNNLDLPALQLLEKLIDGVKNKAFLIISHDRAFLDNIVQRILEIDESSHTLKEYKGNYSQYVAKKKMEGEKRRELWENQQAEIKKLKRSIKQKGQWAKKAQRGPKMTDSHKMGRGFARDRSKTTARAMESLKTKLEKIEVVEKPTARWNLRFNISPAERTGDVVLRATDITKRISDFRLPRLSLSLERGDRIAIIGRNGIGKTTLLRILAGRVVPDRGELILGAKVAIGFLEQIEADTSSETIVGRFMRESNLNRDNAKEMLYKFGVRVGAINRQLSSLSPGERLRLGLAGFVVRGVNFLILDEPTNHLDFDVLDELERVISEFSGTLLVVSHDRRFLRNIGINRIYSLQEDGLREIDLVALG